jgi:hypothetical protein
LDTRIEERNLPDSYFEDGLEVDPYAIPVILPDPTRDERREIRYLKSIYRGVMFVEAKAGQGKDLLVMTLSYLSKRYFGRPVVLDMKPKRLFGFYHPFNPQIMVREINKMARKAGIERIDVNVPLKKGKEEQAFDEAAKEWLGENEVMFQNAVVYLSELGRYCPRRNPHNRVNRFIGSLASQWRHLNMLLIGTHVLEEEIDRTTFLGHTNIWAKPKWGMTKLNTTDVKIERGIYESEYGCFNVTLPPFNYQVDGGEPREFLTTEKTLFKVTPKGLKEAGNDRVVENLAQMNLGTAIDIAKKLQCGVEDAVDALWMLSLKGYVVGNRYFDLYNSWNWVNLKPTLAKEI